MQLRETGFWARLYRITRRGWLSFIGHRGDPRLSKTDLCTFVRTVFVWFPLAAALNLAVLAFGTYSVLKLLFLLWLHLTVVGAIVLVVAAAALTITIATFIFIMGGRVFKKVKTTETARLAGEYIWAKKSAICPTITFGGNTDAAL